MTSQATSPVPLASSPQLRRTRFVCISDTHNFTPKLPKGDVLIHAGDLTNQGTYSELSKAIQWLEKADFEAKIVVAGNHDITLDPAFYAEHGASFHNQRLEDPEHCIVLLRDSPTITYLNHESTTVRLADPDGPHTTFSVFGSPYSPRQQDGKKWAFQYPRFPLASPSSATDQPSSLSQPSQPSATAAPDAIWSAIPLSTDILVTHTPPAHHLNQGTGCEALRQALWRVRPRLHLCGHVHGARGAERVRWDLETSDVAFKEAGVEQWEDPSAATGDDGKAASGKMALVDLTRRKGRPLDNDGGQGVDSPSEVGAGDAPVMGATTSATPGAGTRGLGGDPDKTARCDAEALQGRLGRRETCIANCAIVGTSYPHAGGRRFNKPIVVDIDLPVWE